MDRSSKNKSSLLKFSYMLIKKWETHFEKWHFFCQIFIETKLEKNKKSPLHNPQTKTIK
jgi:hypothetical protein